MDGESGAQASHGRSSFALGWSLLALLAGLGLSALTAWQLARQNDADVQLAVRNATQRMARQVASRVLRYQFGLKAMRGVAMAAGERGLSRERFRDYSEGRDIATEFPGAQGFGYILRVPLRQSAAFERRMRREGMSDFRIWQLQPHQGERDVVAYIQPELGNLRAVGLDIASEPNRRAAAEQALRSGQMTMTAPIKLVQRSLAQDPAFVVLLAVYRGGVVPATGAARMEQGYGWVSVPLHMKTVMGGLEQEQGGVRVELNDVTDPARPIAVYASSTPAGQALASYSEYQLVLGRRWQLTLRAYPGFAARLQQPRPAAAGLAGAFLSLLGALLAFIWQRSHQRRMQLAATQARLATIVENSADAIIGKTLAGVITDWNRSAERMLGFSAAEAIGRPLAGLVVPQERQSQVEDILARVGRGEPVEHFATRWRRKDGSLVDVSVSISPVRDAAGEVAGASTAVRDISRQKQVEAQLHSLNSHLEELVAERGAELGKARHTLRTVVDAVPSLIGYWDRGQINRVANRAYLDWFGVAADSLPGLSLRELLGAELYRANQPYIEAALRGEPQTFERRIPGPDGRVRDALTHYLPDIVDGEVQGFYAVVHDVSELVESRDRQARARQEVDLLLSTINRQLLYSVTDADGRLLEVNDLFCCSHGYAREALLGRDLQWLDGGGQTPAFWSALSGALRRGEAWRGEMCNRASDGGLRWLDTVIAPQLGADGSLGRCVALSIDTTERRRADAELGRVNRLLSDVLGAASEISIIATDVDGVITLFNRGAERMLGYRAEELVGVSTPGRFHPAEEIAARGRELSERYGQPIEGFRIFVHESEILGADHSQWTYLRKDGSQLKISLVVTTMRDDEGRINGYLGIAVDITAQLQQQQELTVARDQLQMAADVAQLGVWSWVPADGMLNWNHRMFEIHGLAPQPEPARQELEYRSWLERLHPDDARRMEAGMMAAAAEGGAYDAAFRVVRPNGEVRQLQAGARIERDGDGRALRFTGICEDVTERQAYEATLLEAKRQAEQASIAKGQFLANMSHEIRTPMNAVLGLLQLLQRTGLDGRQRDYVEKTQAAARSLLGLLNDILDFSKIDAGKLQLDPHPFDLESLMRDLAVVLSGNHGDRNVEVLFRMDPTLPSMLYGDRLRLQQILINLAGNALKFTVAGQVVVSLSATRRGECDVVLRFEILDSGIGISAEQLNRIFEGFSQAEASTSRRFGGTGLGLVISKGLIELMGGRLQVESRPGEGSRFWFELAFGLSGGAALAASWPGDGLRVLVVDDNALAGEILLDTLSLVGWHADYANGGEEAIALARAAIAGGWRYDVVLMDWRMPGLDGVETARRMRQQAAPNHSPVIVMVTAFGREVLAGIAQQPQAPFCDVLTKPVTPQQLVDAIRRAVAGADNDLCEAMPPAAPRRLAGLRLLLVEDNALNRQVAMELLRDEGAEVALAEGGLQGVALASAADPLYDVVIMDVQMPDIDGLEATRRLRADPRCQALPILAMTANASRADRDECLAAGMDDHVGKPIDIDELVAKLQALAGWQARNTQTTGGEGEDGGSDDGPAIEALPSRLRRFGNKLKVYRAALATFRPECERLLADMERQVDKGAWPGLLVSLHALKGVAATMGATALNRQAQELSRLVKAGNPGRLAATALADRLRELERLADSSAGQLAASLPAEARSAPASGALALERDRLRDVLALLEDHNLAVIDLIEELLALELGDSEARVRQAAACVQRLQFGDAIAIVRGLVAAG
ncbi:PAS domain S-box protein [Chromobacterium subtsugae]|uniref:PAS domain S-box protein n=1 Tax=Chromobacterium subtsugae TaxID=251747 RepID=UPI000AA69D46|nr:PAS domain S-box protein [Chromobacterium subtsugae]